jgi:hypothetical protein
LQFPECRNGLHRDRARQSGAGYLRGKDLLFRDIKANTTRYPMSIRLRDGAHIKSRFRENLLGQKAFD